MEPIKITSPSKPSVPLLEQSKEPKAEVNTDDPEPDPAPRPLSPTRLQPVVAPEASVVPDRNMVLQIRAEIPRALKKRGSVDISQNMKTTPLIQPNQYKQIIKKMFRRKGPRTKGETGSDSSSSDGEELSPLSQFPTPPITNTSIPAQQKVSGDAYFRKITVSLKSIILNLFK